MVAAERGGGAWAGMDDLAHARPGAPARGGTAPLGEAASLVAQGLRRPALAAVWVSLAGLCLEAPVVAVGLWFAQYAATPAPAFAALPAAGLAAAGALAACLLLAATGGYGPRRLGRPGASLAQAALALAPPFIAVAATRPEVPLSAALPPALAALALSVAPLRLGGGLAVRWALEAGLLHRRAAVAGGGAPAAALIRGLAARPGSDLRIVGLFDDRDDRRSPPQVLGVAKIGDYDDLIGFVRTAEIDMVIVALPLEAEARINWLLDAFRVLPVEVRLSTYSRDFAFAGAGGDPLRGALRRSFAPGRRLTKRAFDLVVGTAALVALSPVMLAAAIAIRLETPGPILFRQRRHGYNHRVIEVLKFRSMHHASADPDARRVVSRDDKRVTRVGRFLRRSSIDELPQLWNVLRGELSLVGPRPHAVDAVSSAQERFERIVDGYSARHRLPPGITGWAQIHGWRGEIDDPAKLAARFAHDLWYIENWSPWLDLRILLRTPLSLLDSRGAY